MPRRETSQTPAAIRARERRIDAFVRKCESEMNAEVKTFMDKGMAFDDAWIAAGGMIYSDEELARLADAARR